MSRSLQGAFDDTLLRLTGEGGGRFLLGVSGGVDSMCMAELFKRSRLHPVFAIAHVNFRLRGADSDGDEAFVREWAGKNGIRFFSKSFDTISYAAGKGISIEMAARELRYTDFQRIMQQRGASAICIAHHRDDSVETLLLNLIRGTGIKGLTGIKPRNGHIIRPMLCVSRQEIEDWLHEIGQPYVTDSTNLGTDYTRNKIRLQLLPLMRSINPDADNAIADTARHMQQAYTIYNQAIEKAKESIVSDNGNSIVINIPELKKYPVQGAVLFEVLSPLGFNSAQIKDIQTAIDSQPGTRFLSATHQLIKDRESFIVSSIGTTKANIITFTPESGIAVALPDGRTLTVATAPADTPISADPCIATFDADLLTECDITIRPWHDGDWFIPFGMKGRKLVSDYLTDSKISVAHRELQLVATHKNNIIWLLGNRTDNRYRVTPQTNLQLIFTLLK